MASGKPVRPSQQAIRALADGRPSRADAATNHATARAGVGKSARNTVIAALNSAALGTTADMW